jgi:hypothetical protein
MPAQRYRELKAPSVIDTGISQSNAGSEADALARAFGQFEATTGQFGAELRGMQGEQEGDATGATGEPGFRTGPSASTAYGQAYNNAATRSYAIQLDADADESEARIRAQAGTDPEKYKALMNARVEGLMKEADPRATGLIQETYARRIGAGTAALVQAQALEVKNESRVTTKNGATQSVERIGRLRAEGDHDGAEIEKQKLDAMLQSAEADGTFTPAEMKMLRRDADVGLIAQEEKGLFAAELQKPDGDPNTYLENLRKDFAESEVLSSEEEDQIIDGLFSEWRQHNALAAARNGEQVAQHAADVLAVFERQGQAAGASALSRLSGVPDAQKSAVRGKVLEGINERRSVAREANVDDLVAVARAEAQGTVDDSTYAKVEELYQKGALGPDQYASQVAGLDTASIKAAGDTAVNAEVQRSLETGTPLGNVNDKAVKKALASAFTVQTRGMEEGSPEWKATALAFAARTRTLPEQATTWIEKMRRSPDPTQVVPAAQMIASLHETAPQALEGIDEKSRAFASIVNDTAGAGADPIAAVEMARKQVYETDKSVQELLNDRYRKDKVDDSSAGALGKFVDKDFDTVFSSQPDIPLDMQAAFRAQTQRYYGITGGDVSKARELAWKDIKSNYGVSEVNGTKMMMLAPPEDFGVTREQVQTEVGGLLQQLNRADLKPEDIILVPDGTTQKQVIDMAGTKLPPSYAVKDKFGQSLYYPDGSRVRYNLPGADALTAVWEKKRAEAEAAQSKHIDRARMFRDAKRKDDERRAFGSLEPGDY